ncbi:MAG: aminotransferase class V-fold PLP-dependent enzyme [Phycisphaerales bacterium]|nr:MAG: aminotransferase class V-fold PLP-dependent enzyme [Phycisphaerales bacterium]
MSPIICCMLYLDNNATTRPADSVVEIMARALTELWQNPSSVHRPGQRVRQQVELAREQVAQLIGARDREIIFTAGGTEAANLAILGTTAALPDRRVVVSSKLEHSAVRETVETLGEEGREIIWLPSGAGGVVDLNALRDVLQQRAAEIAIVSIMWVNNETGIIQPVEEIVALCREHGVRFHTDAVQWVGKAGTSVRDLPIDLLSFSAHKFHGPKGVGGLYVRRGVRLNKRAIGGPQERERRGGTENVPGILGMGEAARLAMEWLRDEQRAAQQAALRDQFERAILAAVPEASVNSVEAPRMWNTSNIAFPRLEAEAILLLLSERGVCASAGAACSSGSLEPSPVLLAMKVPEERAHGSVRFSLSRETTGEEIDQAVELIPAAIERLRGSMAAVGETHRD